MRRLLAPLAVLALVTSVAACGGDGSDDSSGNGGGSGSDEVRSIRVGTIPIVDTAPTYPGVEHGCVEERGRARELVTGSGRAAAALGLKDRGRLVSGGRADLVAFPTGDYREILYHQGQLKPHQVWKNGSPVI